MLLVHNDITSKLGEQKLIYVAKKYAYIDMHAHSI